MIICRLLTHFRSQFLDLGWIGYDNCNATASKGITIYHALHNQGRAYKNTLDFFRSNILTLRKFKNILRPVNHFHRAVRIDHYNISTFEPTLRVKGLISLVFSLEVTTSY